jgi:UDP-glucuronate 4-epimerase
LRKIIVTGSAGFIGFHLCKLLLAEGFDVVGIDALTDYYDVRLKEARHEILQQLNHFKAHIVNIEDHVALTAIFDEVKPEAVVHLAAQAGVRYSLENPRAYIDTNIIGTFNVMECARAFEVGHLLMASTSSVYGANEEMPFTETEKADTPLTIYAATKKANEMMGHSYAHLWNLPVTMFRFFTVYGPYGRPDMALFKFTKGIIEGTPIEIYNNGDMWRDFTYVEDLVRGIRLLVDAVPVRPESAADVPKGDSQSSVAPFRVVNIGNSDKVRLMDFVEAIEAEIGKSAIKQYREMQKGDVPATWADASLLQTLTGFRPQTDIREGVRRFVAWYRDYYSV